MATTFQYSDRHLIPVWRNFSTARKSPELNSSGKVQNKEPDITPLLEDWAEKPSLVLASEVISAGAISGSKSFAEYLEAQHYLEQAITPSAALRMVLNRPAFETETASVKPSGSAQQWLDLLLEDITVNNIELLWSRISRQGVWNRIHQAKRLAIDQLSNPISWADAAWHYTMDGQFAKAERCMRIALSIDPNNRFVLRAATTLFAHFGDAAQAIHYLRKSTRTKFDPWLVSAHIAASSNIGRFSPFIKDGRALLTDAKTSAFNLTELASSVAMEEYKSGAVKKSRSYFTQALQRPNENTLAQLEWLSIADYRFPFNPTSYQKFVPHPFEANAFECLQKDQWEAAAMNAIRWFLDAPYNRLSVALCVFLLISFFEKYEEAIKFCQAGLQIHHNDEILINNLIYCHAMLGTQDKIPDIIKRFKLIDGLTLTPLIHMAHLATFGLLLFREGAISEGRLMYEEALRIAAKNNDDYRGNIALINYAREIVIANEPDKQTFIARITKMRAEAKNSQILFFCNRFFEEIKNTLSE